MRSNDQQADANVGLSWEQKTKAKEKPHKLKVVSDAKAASNKNRPAGIPVRRFLRILEIT